MVFGISVYFAFHTRPVDATLQCDSGTVYEHDVENFLVTLGWNFLYLSMISRYILIVEISVFILDLM